MIKGGKNMNLKRDLYTSKETIEIAGGAKVGTAGLAAKLSKHRKTERANPKLSLAAKAFEEIILHPGEIGIYINKDDSTVCVNVKDSYLILAKDSIFPVGDKVFPKSLPVAYCYYWFCQEDDELSECMERMALEYNEFGAVNTDDVYLLCDSVYYGFVKKWGEISIHSSILQEEVEAAIRSGMYEPVTKRAGFIELQDFLKYEISVPTEETEEKTSTECSFIENCKAGKYKINYPWDEEQKKYIQKESFLDNFESTKDFESLVKKIKYRADKILERFDMGLEGLEALQEDVVNCMMLGKPGTGKSTIVYAISAAMGIPVYTIVFSKNTDESIAEGKNAIVEGKPMFVETEIPKFWGRGGLFLFEEPNLALADVTMGVFGQALEYPYVIFKNGYERVERHPLSIVIACENVGIAGTKANSPAFSNRFKQKYILDDPTDETFLEILRKRKGGVDTRIIEWVYRCYKETVTYLRSPDVNEEDIVNSLSLRTCIGAIENIEEGETPMEAIKNSIGGAVAEADLEVARLLISECLEVLPNLVL